ncbi:MAG: type VI secretion system tip protein VgrG [Aequorivita antarctica]
MPSSPLVEETNLLSFSILSEGKEIPSTYEVLSIKLEQHLNRIAEAEIVLLDGNPASQTFEIAESNTFVPGAEIEIKLGYHSKNESVFKGIVVKQKINADSVSGSTLTITCKDKALKMAINRNSAIFTDMKDSAAIEKIVGNNGLSTAISATTVEHKEIVQFYATDWDFIISRAEANGMIVITDSGKLTLAKPNVSAGPELQLQFGNDIIEFDVEMDATNQYNGTTANAWDMSAQNTINAVSTEPSVNKQGNLTGKKLSEVLGGKTYNLNSSTGITSEDIHVWSDAALLKSRLSQFRGTLVFQGSSKAKVNSTIKLEGLSSRFNGNAFVSGVIHTVEDGQWHTEVKIGMAAEWFSEEYRISAPEASGLLPGVKGLQTGIVKKMYEDPENQFRVQVEIPLLGAEGEAVWARLATFYAGKSIGAYFMPEVGDEVLLGFMNEDPRFPIILGSVYSSANPAPEIPDENNSIKALITQSKLQLKFDDENKIITIHTPSGNTMILSDDAKKITILDQNSNKIEMSSEGISLESSKSIHIKAAEDVKIEGSNLSIKGQASLKVTAANVAITGDMSTSVKGGAECTISSDGNLSAKGAMVNIN